MNHDRVSCWVEDRVVRRPLAGGRPDRHLGCPDGALPMWRKCGSRQGKTWPPHGVWRRRAAL